MAVLTFSNEKSSRIVGMSYDTNTQELKIEFKRGGTYSYEEVPQEIFEALKVAPSIGQAFNDLVKGGGFLFHKIT